MARIARAIIFRMYSMMYEGGTTPINFTMSAHSAMLFRPDFGMQRQQKERENAEKKTDSMGNTQLKNICPIDRRIININHKRFSFFYGFLNKTHKQKKNCQKESECGDA